MFSHVIPVLLLPVLAHAAVDGIVTNGTTGKPQPNATVTLFQTSNQGPVDLGSVKTDGEGKFRIDKDVQPGVGGGPLLLQAVYAGVQYNKVVTLNHVRPLGSRSPCSKRRKRRVGRRCDQHMVLLEPSRRRRCNLRVSESYVIKNDGKTTWNDPDRGTLQFLLPALPHRVRSRSTCSRPAVCPSGARPIRVRNRIRSNSISR